MIVWHSASACAFRVNVLERQHFDQFCFSTWRKTAAFNKSRRILVGPENTVPNGKIAVVELVNVELVVYGMQLGRLNEVSKPGGRMDIAVIEILAGSREKVVPKGSQQ